MSFHWNASIRWHSHVSAMIRYYPQLKVSASCKRIKKLDPALIFLRTAALWSETLRKSPYVCVWLGHKPQLHSHDSGHDSSRFESDGKIGVHRDASGWKKENLASIRCLAMLLRCLRYSSTDPLRLMTAALRFTTVELRMLTMPPRFDKTLVRFKPVALR